ncbi:MAG: hypothetical protein U1F51_00310 [Burkholderiales bacterium]
MATFAQVFLVLAAMTALAGTICATIRLALFAARALRGRDRRAGIVAVVSIVALIGGLAVTVVLWFARAIGHGEKTIAGDLGLAAVTFAPLVVAALLAWRWVGRARATAAVPST